MNIPLLATALCVTCTHAHTLRGNGCPYPQPGCETRPRIRRMRDPCMPSSMHSPKIVVPNTCSRQQLCSSTPPVKDNFIFVSCITLLECACHLRHCLQNFCICCPDMNLYVIDMQAGRFVTSEVELIRRQNFSSLRSMRRLRCCCSVDFGTFFGMPKCWNWTFLRAQLAKNTGCAGDQVNGFPTHELEKRELLVLRELTNVPSNLEAPGSTGQSVRESGMSCERFRSPSPTRNRWWLLLRKACDRAGIRSHGEGGTTPPSPSRVGTRQA